MMICCGARRHHDLDDASPGSWSWAVDFGQHEEEVAIPELTPEFDIPLHGALDTSGKPLELVPGSVSAAPSLAGMLPARSAPSREAAAARCGRPIADLGPLSALRPPHAPSSPSPGSKPQPAPQSQREGEHLGTSARAVAPRLEISARSSNTAREVRLVLDERPPSPPGSDTEGDLEVALLTPVSMDTVFAPSVPRKEASSAASRGGWPQPGKGKHWETTSEASVSPDRRRRRHCRTLSSTALDITPTPSRGGGERRYALRTPDSMVTERLTPTSSASEGRPPTSRGFMTERDEEREPL